MEACACDRTPHITKTDIIVLYGHYATFKSMQGYHIYKWGGGRLESDMSRHRYVAYRNV